MKRYPAEFAVLAGSTGFLQAARFLVHLLAARWIGPEQFGVWNALALIPMYGVVITLGVGEGMGREVPFLRGAGRSEDARALADAALTWIVVAAVIGAGVIAATALAPVPDTVPM